MGPSLRPTTMGVGLHDHSQIKAVIADDWPVDRLAMASDDAELSSITTAVDELHQRITTLAERNATSDDDTLAQTLFDVERILGEALRRLARLGTSAGL